MGLCNYGNMGLWEPIFLFLFYQTNATMVNNHSTIYFFLSPFPTELSTALFASVNHLALFESL